MRPDRWRSLVVAARLAVAPLALLAFFLPWVEGPGVLRGQTFSGYELLDAATVVQAAGIDGSTTAWATLARVVLVAFAVVAVSNGMLAVLAPRSRAHAATGWTLVALTAAALAAATWQTGMPRVGLWIALAAVCFFAATQARRRP